MTDLLVTVAIVLLGWWHRDPWGYIAAGFAFIFYALHYAGAMVDIKVYLTTILISLGVFSFAKAAWDRRKKKRSDED